jgi:hypothetical protein
VSARVDPGLVEAARIKTGLNKRRRARHGTVDPVISAKLAFALRTLAENGTFSAVLRGPPVALAPGSRAGRLPLSG